HKRVREQPVPELCQVQSVNYKTNIDECANNPCQNSAQCNNLVNAYSCTCSAQWTGTNCDTPKSCSTPGEVSDGTRSFSDTNHASTVTYTCDAGFEIKSGDATLSCSYGTWSGSLPACGDIDECANNPCENSGQCNNLANAYSCTCNSQWSGTNCDTRKYLLAKIWRTSTRARVTRSAAESTVARVNIYSQKSGEQVLVHV
ncbi:SNED1-like protein, partial [Mya arenaria]